MVLLFIYLGNFHRKTNFYAENINFIQRKVVRFRLHSYSEASFWFHLEACCLSQLFQEENTRGLLILFVLWLVSEKEGR